MNKKMLIIQTAFTGDAILATALLERLHAALPDAELHLLVRKGNEGLFNGHPFLKKLFVWNKKKDKYKGLWKILWEIRKEHYDEVINVQRFTTTGLLTAFSGAKIKTGFDKNPLSFLFTNKVPHRLEKGWHETDRNQQLIASLSGKEKSRPKLYPSESDFLSVSQFAKKPYITIAPGSVWFTKTWPEYKWVEIIAAILKKDPATAIYLIGSPDEIEKCERIKNEAGSSSVTLLAGQLTLLQSAALMSMAEMNYSNDSAPMHLCSSMNAPITAIYCSTVPEFGFGPLSDRSMIVQTNEQLKCRPCGLHGYKECPLIHFKCAHSISIEDMIK